MKTTATHKDELRSLIGKLRKAANTRRIEIDSHTSKSPKLRRYLSARKTSKSKGIKEGNSVSSKKYAPFKTRMISTSGVFKFNAVNLSLNNMKKTALNESTNHRFFINNVTSRATAGMFKTSGVASSRKPKSKRRKNLQQSNISMVKIRQSLEKAKSKKLNQSKISKHNPERKLEKTTTEDTQRMEQPKKREYYLGLTERKKGEYKLMEDILQTASNVTPSSPQFKVLWTANQWPDVKKELYFGICLGQGSFARVYEAFDKTLKTKVAVKVFDKRILDDQKKKGYVEDEIFILSKLKHKTLGRMLRLVEDKKRVIKSLI